MAPSLNHARDAAVQRQAAAAATLPATEGTVVGKLGIVDQDGQAKGISEPGLNLRSEPSESAPILRRLPHNAPVYIDRQVPGDWYFAVAQDDGSPGYLAKRHVNTVLPEPGARLDRIKPGETALDIVRAHFDPKAYEWGKDARFYVNVLVLVNSEAHRGGIRKPSPDADWDETETRAGEQIWIPSVEFADTLKGQVSSGSITYGAWSHVKHFLSFLAGVGAFIGGLVVGALESLRDLVAGIAGMAWSILKSLFTGSIISDARHLMKELSQLSASELAEALGDWLEARWNHKSFFKRWYWRGWIIGYAIAEVLMTFFTAGIVQLAKSAARASKLVGLVKKLSAITKLTEAAKALKQTKAVIALKDAIEAVKAIKTGRKARQIENLVDELGVAGTVEKTGKTPEELLKILGDDSRHAAAIQDHLVDKAFAKLEKGEIPQHGEPVQFGRRSKGKPADPTKIPDVGRGVTRELAARVRRVMGKTIREAPNEVQEAWAEAATHVQKTASATKEGMLKAYKEAQKRFWKNVRGNSAARTWFEKSGFWFDEGAEGAPYVEAIKDFNRTTTLEQELRVSLDHIIEKAENPALALDPSNLRFASHWDNWLLKQLGDLLKKLPAP